MECPQRNTFLPHWAHLACATIYTALLTLSKLKNLFNELETKAFGPTAVRDTYYVSHLATAPWAAGHGVGGQLLKAIIERATKEGVPVTLVTMTPRHVSKLVMRREGS